MARFFQWHIYASAIHSGVIMYINGLFWFVFLLDLQNLVQGTNTTDLEI